MRSGTSSGSSPPAPIELHYSPTPNGWKVTMLLEEAALPYTVHPVDLLAGDQHTGSFLRISPNGRMPAMVDPNFDSLPIFESGAIMLHLAESYESARPFLPESVEERSHTIQWLFWVNAGLGPMAGQMSHFTYYAPKLNADADHTYAQVLTTHYLPRPAPPDLTHPTLGPPNPNPPHPTTPNSFNSNPPHPTPFHLCAPSPPSQLPPDISPSQLPGAIPPRVRAAHISHRAEA